MSRKNKNIWKRSKKKLREKNDKTKIIIVKDRGYDSYSLFEETINNKISFIVRLDGDRHMLFKGKKRLVKDVAATRTEKIHTKLMSKGEKTDCYIWGD